MIHANPTTTPHRRACLVLLGGAALLISQSAFAQLDCDGLPDHDALQSALQAVAPDAATNGGLNTHMWATMVNRDGVVCAVAKSGGDPGDQWPGSRVISAQKANTANAFSLPDLALSTANLFSAVQPGGSLYGLQHSNPVDTSVAYAGDTADYGTENDAMVGGKIGGVNVFGGGLGLYDVEGALVGALGVSGDTSCADHNIAWRVRDGLGLDYVPFGVAAGGTDNIIFDISTGVGNSGLGHPASASGFGHPECGISTDEPGINADVVAACPVSDGSTDGC